MVAMRKGVICGAVEFEWGVEFLGGWQCEAAEAEGVSDFSLCTFGERVKVTWFWERQGGMSSTSD